MSMTPKELIKEVYEIAFGEDAYLRGFFPEEVVERLQEFSDGSNQILIYEEWNEEEEHNIIPIWPSVSVTLCGVFSAISRNTPPLPLALLTL